MAVEYLVIDSEDVDGPDIIAEDLMGFRAAMYRGANLTMSGAVGQRPYAPILDALEVSVNFRINGFTSYSGTPSSDPQDTLDLNVEHYRALFCDGGDALTGEKDYTLVLPSRSLIAPVQCWDFSPVRTGPATATVVTRLIVAAGAMVLDPP